VTLFGRKSKFQLDDYLKAATTMGLEQNVVMRLIGNMHKVLPKWKQLIQDSFLSEEMKDRYEQLLMSRLSRLTI